MNPYELIAQMTTWDHVHAVLSIAAVVYVFALPFVLLACLLQEIFWFLDRVFE